MWGHTRCEGALLKMIWNSIDPGCLSKCCKGVNLWHKLELSHIALLLFHRRCKRELTTNSKQWKWLNNLLVGHVFQTHKMSILRTWLFLSKQKKCAECRVGRAEWNRVAQLLFSWSEMATSKGECWVQSHTFWRHKHPLSHGTGSEPLSDVHVL